MTYGLHQEAASEALVALLIRDVRDAVELDSAAVEAILTCRHQAHLALRDRLWILGSGRRLDQPVRLNRSDRAAKQPLRTLATLLRQVPRADVPDVPPSEVLTRHEETRPPIAEHWRALARHLFLGNTALQGERDRFARTPAAEWYLIGDIATTLEALTVLDERLTRGKILPAAATPDTLEVRLIAGNVARSAAWLGDDLGPDTARAEITEATLSGDGPPVRLIRTPRDFAPAQRTLAAFVRPRGLDETPDAYGGRPGLHAARVLSLGQVRLAAAFSGWADAAGATDLATRFRDRIPRYRALHDSTNHMAEATPSRSMVVDLQLSELVQGIRRLPAPHLTVSDLNELDAATHQLTVNVGATLRREGMARQNILIVTETGPQPITSTRNRFNLACRALADEPNDPTSCLAHRHQRERLADVLRSSPLRPAALHRAR